MDRGFRFHVPQFENKKVGESFGSNLRFRAMQISWNDLLYDIWR